MNKKFQRIYLTEKQAAFTMNNPEVCTLIESMHPGHSVFFDWFDGPNGKEVYYIDIVPFDRLLQKHVVYNQENGTYEHYDPIALEKQYVG